MTIEVEGPGGVVVEFPNGTARDVMQAAMQKHFASTSAPPEQPGMFSEYGKAINPLEMAKETGRTASEGVEKIEALKGRGGQGPIEGLLNTGKAVLGAGEVLTSPIIGPIRSFGGHMLTQAEQLAGAGINKLTGWNAQPDPQKMYDVARGDIDTAMMAARPAGMPIKVPGGFYDWQHPPQVAPAPTPPQQPPPILSPAEAAVKGAVESQPRALTTDNRVLQQAGQVVSKIPYVGSNLGRAIEAVPGKFAEARTAVADEAGNYRTPQNVASDIGQNISGAAEAERAAAEAAAKQADDVAKANWERANQEREAAIAQHEQASTQAAQQKLGEVAPVELGDVVGDTIRDNHARLQDEKNAAYDLAANTEGAIKAEGLKSLFPQADRAFTESGRSLSNLTPAANNVREALKNLSDLNIPTNMHGAHVPGAGADSISVQGLNTFRKNINSLANQAGTAEDGAAARVFTRAFDNWQADAMGKHLASGDPETALRLHMEANAKNRDLMQRFGYNDRNDADTIINKIVQPGNQIGSEDISKALFAGGNKPDRLIDSIFQATGDHPNHQGVVQALRGGFWNKIAGAGEGVTARGPEKIASDINTFMNRREVANRLYTPSEQALARAHADMLRATAQARKEAPAIAKASEPKPTEVVSGPAETLADRVLGKGQKPSEALYDTIEGYAKSKGGGKDIETLSQVVNSIPQDLRGSLANTFVRRLGTGLKGEFSPARFADEWLNKVNPRAKMVLLRDGAHIKALDELAAASKQFDEVHRRFGNPSGSGQHVNFAKVATIATAAATGSLVGPLNVLGGWFAGRKFANFLATPAGAASASRFTQQMRRLQANPSMGNAAGVQMTMRNMRNTALGLGIESHIPNTQSLRQLQGPVPAGAQNEQRQPPGVR